MQDGRSLAEIEEFDLAILDINLAGQNVQPVAEAVAARGLPFLFVSGYGPAGVPEPFRANQVLAKPCELTRLKIAIDSALSQKH